MYVKGINDKDIYECWNFRRPDRIPVKRIRHFHFYYIWKHQLMLHVHQIQLFERAGGFYCCMSILDQANRMASNIWRGFVLHIKINCVISLTALSVSWFNYSFLCLASIQEEFTGHLNYKRVTFISYSHCWSFIIWIGGRYDEKQRSHEKRKTRFSVAV